jgi:hypothetical protein
MPESTVFQLRIPFRADALESFRVLFVQITFFAAKIRTAPDAALAC